MKDLSIDLSEKKLKEYILLTSLLERRNSFFLMEARISGAVSLDPCLPCVFSVLRASLWRQPRLVNCSSQAPSTSLTLGGNKLVRTQCHASADPAPATPDDDGDNDYIYIYI